MGSGPANDQSGANARADGQLIFVELRSAGPDLSVDALANVKRGVKPGQIRNQAHVAFVGKAQMVAFDNRHTPYARCEFVAWPPEIEAARRRFRQAKLIPKFGMQNCVRRHGAARNPHKSLGLLDPMEWL